MRLRVREAALYVAALVAVALLTWAGQWHRAAAGEAPHLHTLVTTSLDVVVLIALGIGTADIVRRYLSREPK